MSVNPRSGGGNAWDELENLIQININGNPTPLTDYLIQHDNDEDWRERAIHYLMSTSHEVFDLTTCKKLWAIGAIITFHETRQVPNLTGFFECKWQEFCTLNGDFLNEQQRDVAMASGLALLVILCHLRTAQGIEYLEQIVQRCQETNNRHFESLAKGYLAKARLLISHKNG